jgi:hypothetical protein
VGSTFDAPSFETITAAVGAAIVEFRMGVAEKIMGNGMDEKRKTQLMIDCESSIYS